jgi:hypothetical protein
MHVNDNSQQPEIHEILDVKIKIDSLYNNMKILISNNESIDSPKPLKNFIIEKYKLNDLQLSAFEGFTKMNSTNQLLQHIAGVARYRQNTNHQNY